MSEGPKTIRIVGDLSVGAPAGFEPGQQIFLPALADFPPSIAFDMIQLPLIALNDVTLARLQAQGRRSPPQTFCGIYGADPFADWMTLASVVKRAEFAGVVNFPSLSLLSDAEQAQFDEAGFSFEVELKRLKWFCDQGLSVACVVTCRSQIDHVLTALTHETLAFICIGKSRKCKDADIDDSTTNLIDYIAQFVELDVFLLPA